MARGISANKRKAFFNRFTSSWLSYNNWGFGDNGLRTYKEDSKLIANTYVKYLKILTYCTQIIKEMWLIVWNGDKLKQMMNQWNVPAKQKNIKRSLGSGEELDARTVVDHEGLRVMRGRALRLRGAGLVVVFVCLLCTVVQHEGLGLVSDGDGAGSLSPRLPVDLHGHGGAFQNQLEGEDQ